MPVASAEFWIGFGIILLTAVACSLFAVAIYQAEFKEKIMADLTALEARVAQIEVVVPGIQADYAALKALIDQLKAQIDDTALQAEIDTLTTRLDASLGSLSLLDQSVDPANP